MYERFSFLKFVFAQFQHICSANLVRQIYLTCAFSRSCKEYWSVIIFSTGMKSFVYFYFKLYDQIEGANIFSSFFMPLSGRFLFGEAVRRSVGTVLLCLSPCFWRSVGTVLLCLSPCFLFNNFICFSFINFICFSFNIFIPRWSNQKCNLYEYNNLHGGWMHGTSRKEVRRIEYLSCNVTRH